MRPAGSPALGSPEASRLHAPSALDQRQRTAAASGLLPDLAAIVLESINDRIVVVRPDGLIVAVNRAWSDFARTQSHAHASPLGVGANYLDFCGDLFSWDGDDVVPLAGAIRNVADGAAPLFQCVCRFGARDVESSCIITATPARGGGGGAVIAHTVIERDRHARANNETMRDVATRLVAAQERERIRIGRELHDDLGQQAALLALRLEQLSGNPQLRNRQLRAGVADAERMLHDLAISIHDLSHRLHPAKLRLLGLVATLESLCRDTGARVNFVAHDVPREVPEQAALCAYRVTQEALQNAVKHSGAERISVQLTCADNHLVLRVTDTGNGFDQQTVDRTGIGLVTMRERVELCGGSLKIMAVRDSGTTIKATIPVKRPDSDLPS